MNLKNVLKSKEFWLVFVLWLIGFLLRTYRLNDLLGFYYDQGRDALQVSKIISGKNLPAIGPTTGLEGIYLGPFWFYLLTPFYFIGQGNPVLAAIGIAFIESLSIPLLYYLGKKYFSGKVGFLSAVFWTFSYYLIKSSRWFSNPSPVPFFSLLLVWGLVEWLINKKKKFIPVVMFALAVSSQFEAASAVFYYPAILAMILIFKLKVVKTIKNKWFWLGTAIFVSFLLPQLAFELKNNFLMTKNLFGFFTGNVSTDSSKSWAIPTISVIVDRLHYYYQSFFSKLDPNLKLGVIPAVVWFVLLTYFKITRKNQKLTLLYLFLVTPLIFLFFFVGNYGNLYDYYLTGFFPVFILLFSFVLVQIGWLLIIPLLVYFLLINNRLNYYYLIAGVDGKTHISLANQKQVIEWVCQDHGDKQFNVDTYVPPVIPLAWDYLWQWYGAKLDCYPSDEKHELLYTVWEVDLPYPHRLEKWLDRQQGIGTIIKETRFGGIGIERRTRTQNDEK